MVVRMHISDRRLPPDANLEIHPDVLLSRTELAQLVALIVATWADIEGRLESIFLLCVRDRAELSKLNAMKGWDARSKFFVRKVKELQGQKLATEVRAILKFAAQSAIKRHDIAHGIFAACDELPLDLVLASPEIYNAMIQETIRAESLGTTNLLVNREEILATARVISNADLSGLLKELREARDVIHSFMIERMPVIVHVNSREKLTRAADHPNVAARIRNSEAGLRKRNKKASQETMLSED